MTKTVATRIEKSMLKDAVKHLHDWRTQAYDQGGALNTRNSVATIEDLKMARIMNRSLRMTTTSKLSEAIDTLSHLAKGQDMFVNSKDLKKQESALKKLV